MAKRDRISNRKSLGAGKNHKRNKNPKLSPFQREVKRNRLANQPPTATVKRDFPAKQRLVFNYFHEKAAREEAKKEEKRQRDEDAGIVEDVEKMGKARRRKMARLEVENGGPPVSHTAASVESSSGAPSKNAAKKNSGAMSHVPSLNEEFREGVAPLESRIDMFAVRKREKKLEKRVERRKERSGERIAKMESEISAAVRRGAGKKGKNSTNTGSNREDEYEKEIIRMQREKAKQDVIDKAAKVAAEKAAAAEAAAADGGKSKKKRISFGEEAGDSTEGVDGKHRVARPAIKQARDFYHMVDVVRYGERVEAPPVFETLPDKNSAVSKLAAKLSAEESGALLAKKRATGAASSSTGSFAERKRLATLGLGPRVSGTTEEINTEMNGSSDKSMSSEFETLRAKVLQAYQRNKVQRYQQEQMEKKGGGGGAQTSGKKKMPVDLKHQFPLI
jgi:hypothetical protein